MSKLFLICLWLLFAESILVYLNSEWESTVYSRYAKSMIRNNFTNLLFILSVFLLVAILFVMLVKAKQKINYYLFLIFLILIATSLLWTIISFFQGFTLASIVGSQTPASIFFFLPLFFLGMEENFWDITLKFSFVAGVLYSILSFFDAVSFVIQFGYNFKLTSSPSITFLAFSIFLLSIYIVSTEKVDKYSFIILVIAEILLTIVAILLLARGWMIHLTILMLITYIKSSKKKSQKIKNLFLLLIFISVFGFFSYDIIAESLVLFIDRLSADTRSNQISQFFSQLTMIDILLGQGMGAVYNFGARVDYQFIDNQFLMLLFRYGINSMVGYFLLISYPIYLSLKTSKLGVLKSLPLIMWLLALLGISTYFNLSNNIVHFVIIIYIGRIVYLYNNSRNNSNITSIISWK